MDINENLTGRFCYVCFETEKAKHDRGLYIREKKFNRKNLFDWIEKQRVAIEKKFKKNATLCNVNLI